MNANYVYSQTLDVDASDRREFDAFHVGDPTRISIVRRRECKYLEVLWDQARSLQDQNRLDEMNSVVRW